MKYFLSILFIFSLNLVSPLLAKDKNSADMSALLENKIWKVQLPKDKHYAMEMEFRSAGWKQTFLYDEKQTEICDSYSLHGDTIKSFQKNYIIQELTDSTLVLQYLPESLTIGVTPVRCTTDNSVQGQRQNEERLDSIWCKEDIWNKGVAKITGEPIKDLSTIEPPRWAVWDYDLTKYYVSQMKYPEELLKKNVAGYSVVMFALDTLGLPRWNTILTTIHEDFDKEVIRLTKELPHCLPCRNKNGKRMECLYTVYVPFLPQHYRDRVKADSVNPHTDVLIIGYSSCDTPILMRYDATLTAHTTEPYLEVGVPVCYLNERGDTIVPYGKYRYCQTDTIKKIGFVYENKPKDARIICINDAGKELFYVFKYDNGPDYIQEGLFRIMNEDGLVGFADSLGNVIIEPQFKFAYPFKGGKTKATLKGERKVVPESDGEKHYWESETWFYIDKKNRRLID